MRKIAFILALMVSVTAYSQEHYKSLEGTYTNPSIDGNIVVQDFKLTFEGKTHTFRTESQFGDSEEIITATVVFEDNSNEIKLVKRYYSGQLVMILYDGGKKEYLLFRKE